MIHFYFDEKYKFNEKLEIDGNKVCAKVIHKFACQNVLSGYERNNFPIIHRSIAASSSLLFNFLTFQSDEVHPNGLLNNRNLCQRNIIYFLRTHRVFMIEKLNV
jgi:hypothetical protein